MTVRQTSRQAYLLMPKKSVEQAVVQEITRSGPGTRAELAVRLGRGVNTLTHAVQSLVSAGLLTERGPVRQSTGRQAYVLHLKEEGYGFY